MALQLKNRVGEIEIPEHPKVAENPTTVASDVAELETLTADSSSLAPDGYAFNTGSHPCDIFVRLFDSLNNYGSAVLIKERTQYSLAEGRWSRSLLYPLYWLGGTA